MFNQSPFRSSKSRPRKQDETYQQLNEQILAYFRTLNAPISAEAAWLHLKANGIVVSISSFYTKLKKLVDAGIIEKRSQGYNKNEYLIKS